MEGVGVGVEAVGVGGYGIEMGGGFVIKDRAWYGGCPL